MNREILTLNYPEAKSVVVCGDIHGAFEEIPLLARYNDV